MVDQLPVKNSAGVGTNRICENERAGVPIVLVKLFYDIATSRHRTSRFSILNDLSCVIFVTVWHIRIYPHALRTGKTWVFPSRDFFLLFLAFLYMYPLVSLTYSFFFVKHFLHAPSHVSNFVFR